MSTVTGSAGGTTVTYTNSAQSAADVAQSILASAGTVAVTGGTPTLTSTTFVAANTGPTTITGGQNVSVGVLAGQNAVFSTGVSQASYIVASDYSASTLINNNVNGSLIAFTGAGGNSLSGGGLINGFQTGAGGQDAVAFGPSNTGIAQPNQVNVLTSLGQDTVNIFGNVTPGATQVNAINTFGSGTDNVTLNNGASLFFTNNSTGTSTITASSGSTVNIAGTGPALVLDGGSGSETFSVSTASGNVTLVGSASGGIDTFDFVKLSQSASTAQDVVGNFSTNDTIHLVGYATGAYTAAVVNGSTVLTLSDNTQIVFAGVTNTTAVTSRIS